MRKTFRVYDREKRSNLISSFLQPHQEVVRFDVPMDDPQTVKMVDTQGKLVECPGHVVVDVIDQLLLVLIQFIDTRSSIAVEIK